MFSEKIKEILAQTLSYFLIFILAFLLFYFLDSEKKNQQKILEENKKNQKILEKKEEEKKELEKKNNLEKIFGKIEVDAKSFYIYNISEKKEIFSKNKDKKFSIASLTKVATAEIFLENFQEGKIKISENDLKKAGNNGLYAGENFSKSQVLNLLLIVSSNDIASAVANFFGKENFLKKTNSLAEDLDLKSTIFFSESGLDASHNIGGAYSSAKDISKLVENFYQKYPKISGQTSLSEFEICTDIICRKFQNTNKLLFLDKKDFPYTVLFSKTGYTKNSGGSLSMIFKIGEKEILITLLASTKSGRFSDMEKILKEYKNFVATEI